MAQNHVWRYTLRLFHTFAIFEKKKLKIYTKREAKSYTFVEKCTLGRPRVDILRFWVAFWAWRFFDDFLVGVWAAKNREEISFGRPYGRFRRSRL